MLAKKSRRKLLTVKKYKWVLKYRRFPEELRKSYAESVV